MSSIRRSDFDVTNSVQVSSPQAVLAAVRGALPADLAQLAARASRARVRALRAAVRRRGARLPRRRYRLSRPPAHPRHNAGAGAPAGRLRAAAAAGRRAWAATRAIVGAGHRAVPRRRLPAPHRRSRLAQRRGIHPHPRVARRALSRRSTCRSSASPPGCRSPARSSISPATKCRLRTSKSQVRRAARHHGRPPARHRRHDRADGRPLLSREVPRPAVRGVRARRGGAALQRRLPAGEVRLGPRPAAPDAGIRERRARRSASTAISTPPTATWRSSSAATTRTSKPSTATSSTCARCCAARAGSCCGAARPFSPPPRTP